MNRSIICRKCQKVGRPMCTCWSERGVVVTLKDVALPAVGAKMSTTNGNTAEIADPVGMIHVRLTEGVCTRSEDGQTTPASATTSSSSDIGRTDEAGQP